MIDKKVIRQVIEGLHFPQECKDMAMEVVPAWRWLLGRE